VSVYAEQVIRKILLDDAGVSGVVSTRVYPHSVPKGASLPAIIYSLDTSEPVPHLSGSACKADEFEVLCLADTYGTVKDLAEKARSALSTFNGDVTPSGADTMTVLYVHHRSSTDVELTPQDGSDTAPKAVSVSVKLYSAS